MSNDNKLFGNKKERTDIIIAAVVVLLAGAFIFSKIDIKSPVVEVEDKLLTEENIFENVDANESIENIDPITILEQEGFDERAEVEELDSINNDHSIDPISTIITSTTQIKSDLEPRFKEPIEHKTPSENWNDETTIKTNNREKITKEDFVRKMNGDTPSSEEIEEEIEQEVVEAEEKAIEEKVIEEKILEEKVVEEKITEATERTEYNEKQESIEKEALSSNVTKNRTVSDCTIIVGVFREIENKNKTIMKLIDLGYAQDYGVMRNGSSYVGVPVACDDRLEIKKLINELNNAFNVNTWLKKN